jgi:hypothetical protein
MAALTELSDLASTSTNITQTSNSLKRVDLTRAFTSYIMASDTHDTVVTLLKLDTLTDTGNSQITLPKASKYLLSVQITASIHNSVELEDMLYIVNIYAVDSINQIVSLKDQISIVGASLETCTVSVVLNADSTSLSICVKGLEDTRILWRARCVLQHVGR